MNYDTILRQLDLLARQGRYVYNTADLHSLLRADGLQAARATIARLVQRGDLVRACRGIHVFRNAGIPKARILHEIAATLRRGTHCYVTMESALAAHGGSRADPKPLMVATTGRRGSYETPWGMIEFSQTRRRPVEIVERAPTGATGMLRLASTDMAREDMRRMRRPSVSTSSANELA